MARWSAWIVLIAVLFGILGGTAYGLRQLLLVRNGYFELKHIDVQVYGDLSPDIIREKLIDLGIRERQVNIFAVDMGQLRQDLESWHVQISRVRVYRRLPDTLEFEIYERNPVAQLVTPRGYLIDSNGLVLPRRNDPQSWYLPVITGVRDADQLTAGSMANDPFMRSALKLLELVNTQEYGRYLDVNLIQLDRGSGELKVYLRERTPFRDGACIILPVPEDEMRNALTRVQLIARDRERGQQDTGFINATFERNVPVTRSRSMP